MDRFEHVVLDTEMFAPVFALKVHDEFLKLWQTIEAIFEVIAETWELADVVVVQFEEGAFLGNYVSNFLWLGPVFDPDFKILQEVFI